MTALYSSRGGYFFLIPCKIQEKEAASALSFIPSSSSSCSWRCIHLLVPWWSSRAFFYILPAQDLWKRFSSRFCMTIMMVSLFLRTCTWFSSSFSRFDHQDQIQRQDEKAILMLTSKIRDKGSINTWYREAWEEREGMKIVRRRSGDWSPLTHHQLWSWSRKRRSNLNKTAHSKQYPQIISNEDEWAVNKTRMQKQETRQIQVIISRESLKEWKKKTNRILIKTTD